MTSFLITRKLKGSEKNRVLMKSANQDQDLHVAKSVKHEKITTIGIETPEKTGKETKGEMIAELMILASTEIEETGRESEVVKESVIKSIQGIEDQDLEVKITARATTKKTTARE